MDFAKPSCRLLLAFALLVSLSPLHAQTVPAIEGYGNLPAVSMMVVSPNGKSIAFRRHAQGADTVVAFSLESGEVIRAVDVSEIKLRQIYFFDNASLIMRAEQHKKMLGYRRSFDVSTAFMLNLKDGGFKQLLTPGDNILKGQTGLGQVVGVSEDRTHVYMPAFVDEFRNDPSPNFSLMKVDLSDPRRPFVHAKGSHNHVDYFVDDQGEVLAEELMSNLAKYHSVLAHRDGKKVEIFRQDTEIPQVSFVGLTPDRKALVVSDETAGRTVLRTLSLADGTLSEPVYGREDADVGSTLTDINRLVHGVVYSGFRPSYEFFDPELTRRMEAIIADYPEHSVRLSSWTPDWKHLIVKVEGSNSAGDYFLYSQDQKPLFLSNARPSISPEQINPIASFSFKARDGLSIPTLLTIPLSRVESMSKMPAVMLPHGGPASHDRIEFDWLAQALASRGYLVIQPQFRGSTGFGLEHWRAGRGEWGKKMQDDLTDALKVLASQNLIDPERVCIAGSSYGGYAALAGGAFTPEQYQCVVSVNGVSDLPKMLSAEKSDHGRNHWALAYWEDSIAKGEADKGRLDSVSPVNFADQFQAPVLLIHGKDDRVVRFDQSSGMNRQLKRAKKSVELVELKGEDHYLSNSNTRLVTLRAVLAFVDRHIGDRTAD